MKPERVFKRYDIRGRYPEELDEEFAERLGKSISEFIQGRFDNQVVVCRDNKKSSISLKEALMEGLKASNTELIDIGEGPTDYAAWAGKEMNAVSIQVTSSHMPLDFNGFKLMYPEGNGFVNEDLHQVQDIFRSGKFGGGLDGWIQDMPDLKHHYKKDLVEFASRNSEKKDRKIVVDSLGGTGKILPELLERVGHEVIDISSADRPYIDPPEPKPENLQGLKEKVEEEKAYLGISNDLDADRITVFYDGKFLSGDELFCVLAQLVDSPIVASIDTSQALEDLKEVEHTRVGDPFVMDHALEADAELAGEPNGHYSFTSFVPYNSGILTALILSGLDLEEKLSNIPDYTVHRDSLQVEKKHDVIEALKSIFEDSIISELDGVKFQHKDAEVLVRPSGSSPKIRVIAESQNEKDSRNALDSVVEKVKENT